MKNSMKIAGLSLVAILFAGCANNSANNAELADLRMAVEEARAAAIQANDNAMAARQLAQQNSEKINRVFRRSQMK